VSNIYFQPSLLLFCNISQQPDYRAVLSATTRVTFPPFKPVLN